MKLILLLAIIFSNGSAIFAQTKLPVKQCDPLLAQQIVEQQASESKVVTETDKRIKILIKIADFLWISDTVSARKYFNEAFKIANERFQHKGFEKTEDKRLFTMLPDYRFEVIKAVAKRDSELAKQFTEIVLKNYEEDKEKSKRDEYNAHREINELTSIIHELASNNPSLALTLSRRLMKYPLTYSWYFSLFAIAENNRGLADQIYTELLINYRNADIFRLLYLSAYPFGNERIFGIERFTIGTSIPKNFQSNQELQKQFLNIFLQKVVQLTPENTVTSASTGISEANSAFYALNEMEPIVLTQLPEFNQSFSQTKIHISSIVSNIELETANKREDFNKRFALTFDERLERLEKLDEEGKLTDRTIIELLISAKKSEDFEKGKTWLDKIKDEKARQDTSTYFYYLYSKNDVAERRYDDARKHSEKIVKIDHQAIIYFDIAEKIFKETQNKSDAVDALLEVEKIAKKSPDSVSKTQIFLALANIYSRFDNFNALDALSNAVKTVNKLENENIFTTFTGQQIITKDFSFFAGFSLPGFDLNTVFYAFSKSDFQTSLTFAQSFSDKYYRTLAILAVVKDCELNTKPKSKQIKKK